MRTGGISYTYTHNSVNTQYANRSVQSQSSPSFKSRAPKDNINVDALIENLEWLASGNGPIPDDLKGILDELKKQARENLTAPEDNTDAQSTSESKRRLLSWRPFQRSSRSAQEVSEITPEEDKRQQELNAVDTYISEIGELYKKGSSIATYKPFEFSAPRPSEYGSTEYNRMVARGMNAQSIFSSLVTRNNDSYDDAILKTIKDSSFDVNHVYSSGYNVYCNPLFILATLDKPYLLQEALKKRDADPNKICGMGGTLSPVSRAIDSNSLDCVYVLLKSGKVTKNELQRATSISRVTPEMKKLLNSYPNVESYVTSAYEAADRATKREIKTIDDVLLTPDVDINFVDSNGNSLLHIINYVDDKEKAMKLLMNALKRNVKKINKTNNKGLTPIQEYLQSGKYELVTTMIDSGADLSVFKDSLKNGFGHIVCSTADEENAKKLLDYALEKGLNLDEKNCTGTTIIANAVKTKKYDLLNYLINRGASINIQDDNGMTPLHYACILNDPKSLEILMNSFPNTKIQDKRGKLPSEYLKDPELINYYNMFKSII